VRPGVHVTPNECPICAHPDAEGEPLADGGHRVRCRTCGVFVIAADRIGAARAPEFERKAHIVSARLREASDAGREIDLRRFTLEQLTAGFPERPDPFDCMNRILLFIHDRVASPVDSIELYGDDYPLAHARNAEEFFHYVRHLAHRGDLEIDAGVTYRLTIDGWKRVEEIRRSTADSDQAFVAMWFDPSMAPVWRDGFRPALEDVGFRPLRMDALEYNEQIDDRIIAEMRRSGLLVADFTGNRGGVYFEAGFAMGLGIPVIWTCHTDHVDVLHFDTRQYNYIAWRTPAELRERLTWRIEATIPGRTRRPA